MVANTLFSGYVGHNENWWHILHKTSQHMKASQVYSSGWVVFRSCVPVKQQAVPNPIKICDYFETKIVQDMISSVSPPRVQTER